MPLIRRQWAGMQKGPGSRPSHRRPRIDHTTLFAILERGRSTERKVLVGSRPCVMTRQH